MKIKYIKHVVDIHYFLNNLQKRFNKLLHVMKSYEYIIVLCSI